MAEQQKELQRLTDDIQRAVKDLDADKDGWMRVTSALDKLRQAVEPPQNTLMRQRFHTVQNVCIIIGLEIGLFAELAASKEQSRSAGELAKTTGFDQVFIARVMRLLTGIGFADETGYHEWKANAVTVGQADAGTAGGLVLTNEMVFPIGQNIRQFLRQHKPCRMEDTLPMYDFAMGTTVWETLKTNAEWKKSFDDNMTMRNKLLSIPWHTKYPALDRLTSQRGGVLDKPTIVDIGGNQGVDLQRFADSFPDLDCQLILQDLPDTIAGISTKLDGRIDAQVHDFFTEQPVRGADIYYLKSVLHDWDDTQSIRILSNAARAMAPGSRLLINEMVMRDTDEQLVRADMDMFMYFLSNGMERSRTQWVQLLARVSPPLKLVDVFSAPGDQQSVIETALAD